MQWVPEAEDALLSAVRAFRIVLEVVGAFWIGVGFILTLGALVLAHLRRHLESFTGIRLTFGRYLSLALEFQLASDILSTAIAPSWPEIGKLRSRRSDSYRSELRANARDSRVPGEAGARFRRP